MAITISSLTKVIFLRNTYCICHFEAFMKRIVFFFWSNALLKHDITNLGPERNSTNSRWAFNVLNLIYLHFLCVSFDELACLHEWSRTATHMRRTDMPLTPLDECTRDCCILVCTRDPHGVLASCRARLLSGWYFTALIMRAKQTLGRPCTFTVGMLIFPQMEEGLACYTPNVVS